MADLKVTNALISDLLALQKAAVTGKKADAPPAAEVKQGNEAVRVDVDPGTEKLAKASPPAEQAREIPAITDKAARLLALDVRQSLRGGNLSFASQSEKTILGLFD